METTAELGDTSPNIAQIVADRYRRMTPAERIGIAASMFDAARTIVDSSLPADLVGRDRRLAFVRRLYGDELPEAALRAYAEWKPDITEAEN